jgi:primosomal protein N' (replication factor Y)
VFDPDHYAVRSALNQDYETFFANEMRFRHAGQYPPYTYMIAVTFSDVKEENAMQRALQFMQRMKGNFKTIGVISLLKIHDLCRCRVILKGKDLDEMRKAVREYMGSGEFSLKGLRIDVNPMYLD